MSKYWIVGASWGGQDHQDERFVEQGIWMLGWAREDQPAQYKKASEIRAGDRIAIKRMKGKGQTGIKIKHIGIIKGVILDTDKVVCSVDWVVTGIDRDIEESRGCFKSIHGPYDQDEWTKAIFSL